MLAWAAVPLELTTWVLTTADGGACPPGAGAPVPPAPEEMVVEALPVGGGTPVEACVPAVVGAAGGKLEGALPKALGWAMGAF